MAQQTPESPSIDHLTDRELLVRAVKVGEHLDVMVHEIHQLATTAKPFLERWAASPAGKIFGARRGAGRG